MDIEEKKAAIEAILFAAGREVKVTEIMSSLEIGEEEAITILNSLASDFNEKKSGLKIIRMDDSYQLATKTDYYQYIYPIIDKRTKPNLSNAALETLAIIAYNPRATRPEIEAIRGVNSDGTIYKLLEYGLIEEAGKADLPGRPTTYKTTQEFLKMFGYTDLNKLPELPRYKLDENKQIVIDELIEENANKEEQEKITEKTDNEEISDEKNKNENQEE